METTKTEERSKPVKITDIQYQDLTKEENEELNNLLTIHQEWLYNLLQEFVSITVFNQSTEEDESRGAREQLIESMLEAREDMHKFFNKTT